MAQIGKEYGAALFALGCESGEQREFAEALELISGAIRENEDYIAFLASPSISLKERLAAIEEAFSSSIPEAVVSFLQLLCEKGRVDCLFDAAEEYKRLLDALERVVDAKITSAVELTEDEKSRLKSKLERLCNASVVINCIVDQTLIGGVIIEVDGKTLDGSLRRRLNDVKDVISR